MKFYHLTSYLNARAILRQGLMPNGTGCDISMTRGIECVWLTSVMSMALSKKDLAWGRQGAWQRKVAGVDGAKLSSERPH
jgi:hypothetical protein